MGISAGLAARVRLAWRDPALFAQTVRGAVTALRGGYFWERLRGLGRGIDYPEWIARFDTLSENARARLRAVKGPSFSVLMPVWNPELAHLRAALDSVRRQL